MRILHELELFIGRQFLSTPRLPKGNVKDLIISRLIESW